MSDIVDFTTRKTTTIEPPKPPPHDPHGIDRSVLVSIQGWRTARARLEIEWAKDALQLRSGNDPQCPHGLLDEMFTTEHVLGMLKPKTMLTACEMLKVVRDILAYRQIDKKHIFAKGPVLKMLRHVIAQLEVMDGDMRVGPKKNRRVARRKATRTPPNPPAA
jgi:hypothetical protein